MGLVHHVANRDDLVETFDLNREDLEEGAISMKYKSMQKRLANKIFWYNKSWLSKAAFLHDRPWILPWIKSISNELDITCHVFASQLSDHCDVIANRLWRHQQIIKRASETLDDVWRSSFLVSFMDSLCRVRNKIMYVLLWRTVYALTQVLFRCSFPSLLRNSGNKHQNNPLVSAYTVCHGSTYIILYLWHTIHTAAPSCFKDFSPLFYFDNTDGHACLLMW